MSVSDTKFCSKCELEKSVTQFQKCSSHKDGLRSQCVDCVAMYYVNNRKEIYKKCALKRESNPNYRLAINLRNRLNMAIRNNQKVGSAVRDLGCSIEFLKQYLESKFLSGMTWDNYGFGDDKWHIDHVIPLSNFDLTDRDQFLKACYYTNLQPLWQPKNFSKGSRLL